MNLEVTSESIKKAIMGFTRQTVQHLIDKGQRVVVLPCSGVQSSIIDAHSPRILYSLGDHFTIILFNHSDARFLGNNLDRLTHSLSEIGS